ncbi:unnamed protein product [Cuscuta campestris]|uniref:Uncharacterized protein n=1 Tax=Cuscuta campestris TaxID=132261 RepID=A0A484LXZ4_9ASTE|nr:unnamed protein product [Cuscuta campestris]
MPFGLQFLVEIIRKGQQRLGRSKSSPVAFKTVAERSLLWQKVWAETITGLPRIHPPHHSLKLPNLTKFPKRPSKNSCTSHKAQNTARNTAQSQQKALQNQPKHCPKSPNCSGQIGVFAVQFHSSTRSNI